MAFLVIQTNIQAPSTAIAYNLKVMREEAEIPELRCTTSFADDKVKIYWDHTGGIGRIRYNDIDRLVETENIYALFTKANQLILVNKPKLIQEQKSEDFIYFIRNKCKTIHLCKKIRKRITNINKKRG